MKRALAVFGLLLWVCVHAQAQSTITVTTSNTVLNSAPILQGPAIPQIGNYGSNQILKNLVGSLNPGNEGRQNQTIWIVPAAGTGANNDTFTTQIFQPNGGTTATQLQTRWNGATATVVKYASGSNGCVDSIGAVTAQTSGSGYTMTLSLAGACPNLSQKDVVVLDKFEAPVNGSAYTYIGPSLFNGATLTYNTTAPIDGLASLEANTTAGSSAGVILGIAFDVALPGNYNPNRFITLNGTYQVSVLAKKVSGTGAMTLSAARSGGQSCSGTTVTATSTAATLTATCTFSEAAGATAANAFMQIEIDGNQDIIFDDWSMVKTSGQDAANTSVFTDEFVHALKNQLFAGGSGTLRLGPLFQNCQTWATWQLQGFNKPQCNATTDGPGLPQPSLKEFLDLAQAANAVPVWHLPAGVTAADAASEVNLSSTYGFAKQVISFANEAWNTATMGQNLPNSPGQADQYEVYTYCAGTVFAAIRASGTFNAATTRLILNTQYTNLNGLTTEVAKLHARGGDADGPEFSPYWAFWSTANDTAAHAFQSGLSGPYIHYTQSGSYLAAAIAAVRASSVWGPSGAGQPFISNYEQNDGEAYSCGQTGYPSTCQPSATAIQDAQMLQIHNVGAANGLVAAEMQLEAQAQGIGAQTAFAGVEFGGPGLMINPNSGQPNFFSYQYAIFADIGGSMSQLDGAPARLRGAALGIAVANSAILPTMISCPNNSATYSQVADPDPNYGAATAVPLVRTYCYKDGAGNFRMAIVNHDTVNSQPIQVAGTYIPSGAVTGTQFAPSSLFLVNEASAVVPTNSVPIANTTAAAATMSLAPVSFTGSTFTVPPGSVTTIAWGTPSTQLQNRWTYGSSVTSGGVVKY